MSAEVRGTLAERIQEAVKDAQPPAGEDPGTRYHEETLPADLRQAKVCDGCHGGLMPSAKVGVVTPTGPWGAAGERQVYCERCVRVLGALPTRAQGMPVTPPDDPEPRRRGLFWKER